MIKKDIVMRITESVIETNASKKENLDRAINLKASLNQNNIMITIV
jgi:hypothetical protein